VEFLRKQGYQIEYQKGSRFSMVEPGGAMRVILREDTGELLPAIALMTRALDAAVGFQNESGIRCW
jgi:predicted RNA binding protein YcfA (HicA-like mRNA interferase family)